MKSFYLYEYLKVILKKIRLKSYVIAFGITKKLVDRLLNNTSGCANTKLWWFKVVVFEPMS